MNKRETIQAVAKRSEMEFGVCQEVIKDYERYCQKNITRCRLRNIAEIVQFIAADTGHSEGDCEIIMINFFAVLDEEIERKKGGIKMRKNRLMVIAGVVICVGLVSQVVERNLDEEAVKSYVTANFQEDDEIGGAINFEMDDREEGTWLEKLGF